MVGFGLVLGFGFEVFMADVIVLELGCVTDGMTELITMTGVPEGVEVLVMIAGTAGIDTEGS